MELDRLLWCERCRRRARDRAGWWGWLAGVILAACVAAYIWLVIRPTDLVIGGWIATVLATAWLCSKLGREVAYGVMRFKNSKAVDAAPPPGEAAQQE
jgi:hypothetical protein